MKTLIIDPPSGWRYGFPKPIPQSVLKNEKKLTQWFLEQGYPEKDIRIALKHSRYWES